MSGKSSGVRLHHHDYDEIEYETESGSAHTYNQQRTGSAESSPVLGISDKNAVRLPGC